MSVCPPFFLVKPRGQQFVCQVAFSGSTSATCAVLSESLRAPRSATGSLLPQASDFGNLGPACEEG